MVLGPQIADLVADGWLSTPVMYAPPQKKEYHITRGDFDLKEQFEAMKECGDVKAVVFGHDHLNSFTAEIDGIDIIQTPCTSFRCYGSRDRGVRLFTVYENGEYESEMLTYKDLCGSGFISEFRYLWDADDMWKKKAALCVGAGAAAVGVSAALIAHAVHKK